MNRMFDYLRDYWQLEQVSVTKKVNGLVFYSRKIPVIGKFIPTRFYQSYELKQILTVIGLIIENIRSILAKGLWLALYYGLAILLSGADLFSGKAFTHHTGNLGLFLWFMVVAVLFNFYDGFVISREKRIVDFIEHFQRPKQRIIRGYKLTDSFIHGLRYLPAAIIYGFATGEPIKVTCFIFLTYVGSRCFYLYLGRIIFTWHLSKRQRVIFGSVVTIVVISSTVILVWEKLAVAVLAFFLSWVGITLSIVSLIFSWYALLHFKRELDYVFYWSEMTTLSNVASQELASGKSYLSDGLAMQKKLVMNQEERFAHLDGNQYLNALLFSRYRKILNRAFRLRVYTIIAALIVVVILSFFDVREALTEKEMTRTLSLLFFIMYVMSFGKKVVQMVFVNCDVAMLYYPFYREAGTIIHGFNYRFKQTFFYNGLLSIGIFSVYLLLSVLNGFFLSWTFFGVLALLLLALSALFSFHELFIYYLIQPFTSEMEVVSPLYKIIAILFYWIAYGNLQLKVSGFFYAIIVSVACLLYVGIGFVIIYKKAPKTFRIKD